MLEKLRGLRSEPAFVVALREHKWTSEDQKKDLLEKFQALPKPEVEWVVWTAVDSVPEIRAAGLAILKRRHDRAGLEALVPHLKTRSEAVRRAVMRFLKELAGPQLGPFLQEVASRGDDFARLAALELARELPAQIAFDIARRVLTASNPAVRARALKAVSEMTFEGSADVAASLAVPLLQDENEEIRYSALAVLEKNPNESYFPDVLQMARTGGGRVMEASFGALKKLLAGGEAGPHARDRPAARGRQRAGEERHGRPASPLRAGPPRAADPRALPRLVRLGARPGRRDGARRAAGLRERAPEAHARSGPRLRQGGLGDDARPRRRQGAAGLDLALDDKDIWVKTRALETLGRLGKGDDAVLTRVLAAVRDPELAIPAVSALGDLGDPRAAQPLLDAFKAAVTQPDVQMEILDAMAKLASDEKMQTQIAGICARVAQMPALDGKVREKARRTVGILKGTEARDALPEVEAEVQTVELAGNDSARLVEYLADTVKRGASDLHLATGFVPHRRQQGVLEPVDAPVMTRARASQLIREVLPEDDWKRLEKERQIDVCLKLPGLGRFRANFFSQRGGFDACFRVVPKTIPTIEEIGLPGPTVADILKLTQGLVLVTGPSGCGKSTTLAALIDRINETRPCHIITVEDPVEFVHLNKEALVNQRQVPHQTASFARALKAALREDPDVILVGEMRDLETISLAITASETGHLVLGTLHTTNAPSTVDRVISSFPPGSRARSASCSRTP